VADYYIVLVIIKYVMSAIPSRISLP